MSQYLIPEKMKNAYVRRDNWIWKNLSIGFKDIDEWRHYNGSLQEKLSPHYHSFYKTVHGIWSITGKKLFWFIGGFQPGVKRSIGDEAKAGAIEMDVSIRLFDTFRQRV